MILFVPKLITFSSHFAWHTKYHRRDPGQDAVGGHGRTFPHCLLGTGLPRKGPQIGCRGWWSHHDCCSGWHSERISGRGNWVVPRIAGWTRGWGVPSGLQRSHYYPHCVPCGTDGKEVLRPFGGQTWESELWLWELSNFEKKILR